MSKEFKREERYIVFKMSDLGSSLKGDEIRKLAREYAEHLEQLGKKPLDCVVVESDWPEYEPTWKAIEARVTGTLCVPEESAIQTAARIMNIELIRERDALRAKIEAIEQQEPVKYERRIKRRSEHTWGHWRECYKGDYVKAKAVGGHYPKYSDDLFDYEMRPIYALPGAQPSPSFADAYRGAMEEVAIWKKRALEAEDLNRKFIAEINGPTHMGEPAQNAPSAPNGWLRAIDEALVVAHIGVANPNDTYEQARVKLDSLIGFHADVATDPAVNGGWKLVPIEPTEEIGGQAMIQLTDINGRVHAIHPDAIARLVEPGSSGKWHGVNCYVRTFDGDTIEVRESVYEVMEMIAAAQEVKP